MVTIKALCDDLAAALGMSPHDVANVGDELSRADMISQSDARATVEDAAMLLIGVTADYLCRDRASVVKKFWDIPLIEISNLPEAPNSPLKKALLTGFHSTAKHNATKAVSPSSETMRTI